MNNNSSSGTQTPAQSTASRTVDSLASAERPMQQAVQTPNRPKKHKKGLIVAIIICLLVIIGGSVLLAVALQSLNKKDPVIAAMTKIMNGDTPDNVAIDGDISISSSAQDAIISNIKISLESGLKIKSLTNSSKADVTATIRGVGDFTVQVDEVYATGDDLFFKIDGATNAIEESGILYLLNLANKLPKVIDCGEDEHCQSEELTEMQCIDGEECETTNTDALKEQILPDGGQVVLDEDTISFFASMIDAIELIDGEWLRISLDDIGSLTSNIPQQSNASCIVNLISNLNTNSNSTAELYNKYPFILSTDKDIPIESKQYPVREIVIDAENFANFVNSIRSTSLSSQIYSCLNMENNVQISEQDAEEIIEDLPTVYVEVDDDNNFARLYVKSVIQDTYDCDCSNGAPCDCISLANSDVVIDLGLTYPLSINVPEPLEYQDFSDVIQDISASIYNVGTEEDASDSDTTDDAANIDK